MKEGLPKTQVDWSKPENNACQHNLRYEDGLFNVAAFDAKQEITIYNGADIIKWGPNELTNLRAFAITSLMLSFINTGGSPERAKEIIDMGNDMQGAPPRIIPARIDLP